MIGCNPFPLLWSSAWRVTMIVTPENRGAESLALLWSRPLLQQRAPCGIAQLRYNQLDITLVTNYISKYNLPVDDMQHNSVLSRFEIKFYPMVLKLTLNFSFRILQKATANKMRFGTCEPVICGKLLLSSICNKHQFLRTS